MYMNFLRSQYWSFKFSI